MRGGVDIVRGTGEQLLAPSVKVAVNDGTYGLHAATLGNPQSGWGPCLARRDNYKQKARRSATAGAHLIHRMWWGTLEDHLLEFVRRSIP